MPKEPGGGQTVITMAGFVNAARFNSIHEVEAYWEAIRAGRLVPRRSDIDPRGIERALEYAFILERVAPGIARLRIAGSHLSDLMGMEVRGMPLSAFMTPQARSRMGEILEEVFDSPAKGLVELTSEGGIGKPEIDARLLLLPMKSDLGDISRLLGCLVTNGEIGRAPRRFEITGSRVTPLLGDFMKTDGADPAPTTTPGPDPRDATPAAGRPARGMEDPAAPFRHAGETIGTRTERPAAPRRRFRPGPRPYLQVVDMDGDEPEGR